MEQPSPGSGSVRRPAVDVPDHMLWQGLGDRNPESLAALFDRHARAVYNFAFRRTASWSIAEDLTQTTFTSLWRRAAQGTLPALEHASALAFLLGVADQESRNLSRSRGRLDRLHRRLAALDPAERGASSDPADDVVDRLDDERRMAALRRAVEALPAHERQTLELVSWAGLSVAQAATTLGVAEGTVKSRLFRARGRLASILTPAKDGDPR